MEKMSVATFLAWQLAGFEAVSVLHQKQIEKEHIFLGITKLLDMPQNEIFSKMRIPQAAIVSLKDEIQTANHVFDDLGVGVAPLRRQFRAHLGVGPEGPGTQSVHRSHECKRVFSNAEGLRQRYDHKEITLIHLLSALLNEGDNKILEFLKSKKINIHAFQNKLQEDLQGVPALTLLEKQKEEAPKKAPSYAAKIGRDLTELARKGKLGKTIGRDAEIKSIAQTLGRRRKNSAILIGDPGVGKTTVVEGLAQKLESRELTGEELKDLRIIEIRMGEIMAGAKLRGDLEERLMKLLKEAERDRNLIVFIDEIHTIMQAAGGSGSLGVGDILKPALQSGDFRCIGATTFQEYKKYIESDPALQRRFQPIIVKEPTRDEAAEILSGLKASYEEHHNLKIQDEAIVAAVDLSRRYLPDLYLPDKALDLLDEAASMLRIHSIDSEKSYGDVLEVYHIAEALSRRKGIPADVILCSDEERVGDIKEKLEKRIIGQPEALAQVSEAMMAVRALGGMKNKPLGAFLFAGATGTGKTEMAKALADILFDGNYGKLLTFDMSEYTEEHSVARLIGSPPGYVGHEEGGQLVEQVKRNPYSVILFDEIEKAHPKIFDTFLQILDEARLTDGAGRRGDFQNTFIILTSNVGSKVEVEEVRKPIGIQLSEKTGKGKKEIGSFSRQSYKTRVLEAIRGKFRPEFLGRLPNQIVFYPLEPQAIKKIITDMLVPGIERRFSSRKVHMKISDDACQYLIEKSDIRYGVRNIIRLLETEITQPLTSAFMDKRFAEGDKILIEVKNKKIIFENERDDTLTLFDKG
jgi:ATP-dependent Clp protease ATP-binding subunit ClpC